MAYENMTYEVILTRLLDRVTSNYPNVDTREGSMIHNALAPAAMELAIAYNALDNVRDESFVETGSRECLYMKCREIGIDTNNFEASSGVFKGVFDIEIEIGSRWNCDLYNYEVTSYIGMADSKYEYELTCESTGTAPNSVFGTLTPISYLPIGLNHAELTECLIEGESERTNDEIRATYFSTINASASDGNVGQYKEWCANYAGIGNHKIFPLWNGANTVKVSILSVSNRAASPTLVSEFQEYLDPNVTGMGDGEAPIGAFVTVSTATEVPIGVMASIKLVDGYNEDAVKANIEKALSDYFAEMSYVKSQVNYMQVGATIISADGVEYLNSLSISKGEGSYLTDSIALESEEIPVIGNTVWTVTK